MKNQVFDLRFRASVLTVQSALVMLAAGGIARAAEVDPALADLTTPTNSVEVGGATTSRASAKANEYTGLRSRGYAIGNLDLSGGAAYDSDDTFRWRVRARDVGLETRDIGAQFGAQGSYRIDLDYSELLRNKTDTYSTPYLGVGTKTLLLPSNWQVPLVPRVSATLPAAGVAGGGNARGLSPAVTNSPALINGVLVAPTAAQLASASAIQGADLPAFNNYVLSTKRTQYGAGYSLQLDPRWQFTASYSDERKTGLRAQGSVTAFTGADISTSLPVLIDQNTKQVNAALTYLGEALTFNVAYYGSLYTDNVPSMSWANWAIPGNVQTMSMPPSNQFHQLNANAVYSLNPTTRLVGNISYGRNTQNDSFLTSSGTPLVPTPSLHGLVVTEAVNVKLVNHPTKDLTLSAAYKFDERDNRTPVNTYAFYDAGAVPAGTSPFAAYFPGTALGSNANINANRPYSKRLNQINLDADYRVNNAQALKFGVDFQDLDRYCHGTWIDCVDAAKSREGTLRAEWRLNPVDNFSARVLLSGSVRKVDYNEDSWLALVPAANLSPTGAPNGATAFSTLSALGFTGFGPGTGLLPAAPAGSAQAFFFPNNSALSNALYGNVNRISELPGMRRFNMADRDRGKVRTTFTWQATESLSFQAGGDYNRDRYGHSIYGLQNAKNYALNLDATWNPTEDAAVSLFFTGEDQRSTSAGNTYTANSATTNVNGFTAIAGGCFATIAQRNANNIVDPCLNWSAAMRDKVDTIGLNVSHRNLMGGKLDVNSSLTFSRARSDIGVAGGNYVNNPLAVAGAAPGTVAAFYIQAAPLPTVKSDIVELRFNFNYHLSRQQTVRLLYAFQHLKATDWAFDGLQLGGLAGVLPTGEQVPTYNVHTVGVSYVYAFR